MERPWGRLVAFLALAILLIVGTGVFVCHHSLALRRDTRDQPPAMASGVETNPHAPNAKHPQEVARILKLLPEIPVTASFDEIIAMLGLPKDRTGGSVSSTHCTMTWDVAPGYRFALSFDPEFQGDKLVLVFAEASFAAQSKPGFAPHEYHTVYPYRTWKGMVYQ
jgi:hypothetical protein